MSRRPKELVATRWGGLRRVVAGVALTALAVGGLSAISLAAPRAADAAPGNPGTPSAPTTVFTEDFQNVAGPSPIQRLTAYTGATGQKYTADQVWLQNCNGWIASANQDINASAQIADCGVAGSNNGAVNWNSSQQLAWALGISKGQSTADARNNYADTAFTAGTPGVGRVEFQTATNVPFTAANRFVAFSADVAAMNCSASAPLLQFQLLDAAGTATNTGSAVNGCTGGTSVNVPALGAAAASSVSVKNVTSNGATLFSGSSVGLRMLNNNGSGGGNDHTIDNLRILDVTPQLDKAFSPASVPIGGSSTLTFTVTNTSELGAKNGWSFTDNLPTGLKLANNTVGGTCNATTAATAGATSVAITNGQLNAGQASCTITVQVTSNTVGNYTNGPRNVTTTGLNPPGDTTVTFTNPFPNVTCTSDPSIFNTGYNSATDGQLANGAFDPRWVVAGGIDGFNHFGQVPGDSPTGASPTTLPPAGATYAAAQAGKVNNAWANSQSGKSQWISANYVDPSNGQNQSLGGGDWYYRYQFNLDSRVDPSTFQLNMKWLADNSVAGVWVNNVAQTGANLPQSPNAPYIAPGFQTANAASTSMQGDWRTGLNTILVQIKSYHVAEGFNAEVTSAALCPDPRLTITKKADTTDLPQPGDKVTYTVTAKNTSTDAFTADHPAQVTDDMAAVLDDADLDEGSLAATVDGNEVADPTFTSPNISWSGPLAAGKSVVLTYTVTYNGEGDHVMTNNACVPEDDTTEGADSCVSVQIPAPAIDSWKTVESSATPPVAGSTLTYTLHFENTGAATGPVNKVDNLTGVLDDATVTTEPATATGPLTATRDGNIIAVTGNLPAGQTSTVTYTVTVKPYGTRGDDSAENFLLDPNTPPPTTCTPTDEQRPDCTVTPLPDLVVSKSVDPKSGTTVTAGQVLTYTLTFDNSKGKVDAPVTGWKDDLSKVLDDATVTTQPASAMDSLDVSDIENRAFTVGGTVPAGQTGTVTYKVTVKADGTRGDNNLGNALSDGGPCAPGLCTENPIPEVVSSKSVDPKSGTEVTPGQVLTYTLTFTNKGKAAGDVDKTDDLTKVVDDATVTKQPTVSDKALESTKVADGYQITGTLAAGQTVKVTYQVTVKADGQRGDSQLGNFLVNTGDEPVCNEDRTNCTENPVTSIADWKTVDPATTTDVVPGQVLTYTLHFKNNGGKAGTVKKDDDITHAIDDATVTKQPTVQGGNLKATTFGTDNRAHVTGSLPAGATATVTYQLTVKAAGKLGDGIAANFLLNSNEEPPKSPVCKPTSEQFPDCTVNPIGNLKVTKIVDPNTGTTVHPGDTLHYTLSFENVGAGTAKVNHVDDMTGVLDDADVTSQPVASSKALTLSKITDAKLTITGTLAAKQKVIVTYAVTTKPFAQQGDHVMENYLDPVGFPPAPKCVSTDPTCTHNPIAAPPAGLAFTGTELVGPGIGLALMLLALGGGLLVVRRRRNTGDVQENA